MESKRNQIVLVNHLSFTQTCTFDVHEEGLKADAICAMLNDGRARLFKDNANQVWVIECRKTGTTFATSAIKAKIEGGDDSWSEKKSE
jgi:hypothetical protein